MCRTHKSLYYLEHIDGWPTHSLLKLFLFLKELPTFEGGLS